MCFKFIPTPEFLSIFFILLSFYFCVKVLITPNVYVCLAIGSELLQLESNMVFLF